MVSNSDAGSVLRAARLAAGLSLTVLARQVNYTKPYLSQVETGKRRVTEEVIRAYEQATGLGQLSDDVNRRELLAVVAGVVAGGSSEPVSRLLHGLSVPELPHRVGQTEIAAVRHATVVYTDVDMRFGGVVASDVAQSALKWAVGLLDAAMTEDTKRVLSTVVGALADRLAWASYDAGRTQEARRLATLALRTTKDGTDADLRAHVLIDIAAQVGDGDPASAADILDAALADDQVCSAERENLRLVKARHLAKAGVIKDALKNISLAQDELGKERGEVPQWATFLSPVHLQSVMGRSLIAAKQWNQAAEVLSRTIDAYSSKRARSRAHDMVRLATVYVHQGRRDDALALATEAEKALQDIKSRRTNQELGDLKHALTLVT